MTSVQNHRQPSNGNSIILLLLLSLILGSCGIFMDHNTYRRPVPHPHKNPVKTVDPIRVDTIIWEDGDEIVGLPPTTDELKMKYNSIQKAVYKISVILPLKVNILIDNQQLLSDNINLRFINYYGGLLLALEDLETENVSLEVDIVNSKIKNNDESSLFRKLNKFDPDVIIGPYDRKLLKSVARYGKRKNISVVSPWQSSSKIARGNPNYIQLKPDIKTFYEAIVNHVDHSFSPEHVFLIGRENVRKDVARLNYLQELHRSAVDEYPGEAPFNVFYVEEDSLNIGETAFDSLFTDANNEIAVILPNWSYKDEQFIYSCVRKLNAERQNTSVYLYGMPILIESDKIGFNLYENLNMRIALSAYVNKDNWDVKEFKKRYFLRYNAIPSDDAFEAYDMMMYIGRNLNKYGTKFQYFLPDNYQEFLQTGFNMAPIGDESDILNEQLNKADYFENIHIDIRAFKYNGFERIN